MQVETLTSKGWQDPGSGWLQSLWLVFLSKRPYWSKDFSNAIFAYNCWIWTGFSDWLSFLLSRFYFQWTSVLCDHVSACSGNICYEATCLPPHILQARPHVWHAVRTGYKHRQGTRTARRDRPSHLLPNCPSVLSQVQMSSSEILTRVKGCLLETKNPVCKRGNFLGGRTSSSKLLISN